MRMPMWVIRGHIFLYVHAYVSALWECHYMFLRVSHCKHLRGFAVGWVVQESF